MKYKNFTIIGITLLILTTVFFVKKQFSNTSNYRSIASADPETRSAIFKTTKHIKKMLYTFPFDQDNCASEFGELHKMLLNVRSKDVDTQLYDEEAQWLMEEGFLAQLQVREIIKSLEKISPNNLIDGKCLDEIRNFSRALRYVQDYLAIRMSEMPSYQPPQNGYSTLSLEKGPHFMVNPAYRDSFRSWEDLKSGDIIVSRGNAFTSAAIARFTRIETQFSHISLVYQDKEGKLYTSEAHIEIGNVAAPFIEHINEENARTVVYRFKDSTIAGEAARIMYSLIKGNNDKGKNIKYDFSMRLDDSTDLFCSEVAHVGYRLAEKDLFIPKYTSSFDRRLLKFLKQVGIGVTSENIDNFKAFAPGDMEFDTRFDLVAEWKNFDKLKNSRIKDAVLTMIFKWMKEDQYEFRPDLLTKISSTAFFIGRRIPIVEKLFKKHFPLNMNIKQLSAFRVLDKVGETLQKKIEEVEHKRKVTLTPIEMYEELEKYRKLDLEKGRNYGMNKSDFHYYLRPRK